MAVVPSSLQLSPSRGDTSSDDGDVALAVLVASAGLAALVEPDGAWPMSSDEEEEDGDVDNSSERIMVEVTVG